ncbi:hypothetical protein K4749_11365 [Streptomyces sp. TRM72054]|uniref:hypothetical protein n=1 Tax=Streptomyces sp. TRM72054 TaxID=2870562 RepID=UPI001C8B9207|nr:hypothetical protein [Streptomyces sp. TRM72054]MBX9394180.1 hypothetical protein [Streptomyces sp. TRM72054]
MALSTPDIRGALSASACPTGKAAARLQATALQAADEITAVVADDYQEYIAVRGSARRGARRPAADGTLPPGSLVTAGWVLAVVGAVGTLVALLDTAIRRPHPQAPPHPTPGHPKENHP